VVHKYKEWFTVTPSWVNSADREIFHTFASIKGEAQKDTKLISVGRAGAAPLKRALWQLIYVRINFTLPKF
jgi:hypothetical protein